MLWMSSNHLGHSFKLGSAKSSIIKRVVYPPSKRCFQRSVRKQIDVVRFSVLKGLFLKSASVLSTSLFGWILHTFKMSEIFFCLSRMSTSPPSSFATSIKFAGPFLEVWGWPTKVILNCCTVNSTLEWAEIWLKMNKTLYTKLLLQRYATKNCYFCLFSSRERQNLYWYLRTLL